MSLPGAPAGGRLQRRLVLSTVGIVTALAVLLGTLTTLGVRQLLLSDRDSALDSAFSRTSRSPRFGGGSDDEGSGSGRTPPVAVSLPGQEIGTIVVIAAPDLSSAQAGIQSEDGPEGLGDHVADVKALLAVPTDYRPHDVTLPSFGRYRVLAATQKDGVVVVALPLERMDSTLTKMIGLEVLLTLLALAGALVLVTMSVRSSLRPLHRLADTAHEVSALELTRGEVDLSVRVPAAETDPRDEVGRVGSAFNHMLDHVGGALAMRQGSESKLRQFVADASHELRNPLAAIRGYAELTRRGNDDLPDDTRFALGRIESEATRMTSLVEDLLLLARLDSGPAIELGPVDLGDLVVDALADARAAGPDHRWTLSVPSTAIEVEGDRNRLQQVLVNLLGNARSHTPAGTEVQLRLDTEPDPAGGDGWARITVHDDGPGVPAELQPHIFERFTRADVSRTRASGGTGLGLAIVSAVVTAHRGEISLTSGPGDTTFTVRIPLGGPEAPRPEN